MRWTRGDGCRASLPQNAPGRTQNTPGSSSGRLTSLRLEMSTTLRVRVGAAVLVAATATSRRRAGAAATAKARALQDCIVTVLGVWRRGAGCGGAGGGCGRRRRGMRQWEKAGACCWEARVAAGRMQMRGGATGWPNTAASQSGAKRGEARSPPPPALHACMHHACGPLKCSCKPKLTHSSSTSTSTRNLHTAAVPSASAARQARRRRRTPVLAARLRGAGRLAHALFTSQTQCARL